MDTTLIKKKKNLQAVLHSTLFDKIKDSETYMVKVKIIQTDLYG